MTPLTYLELFAGAGGMSAGLELAGWQAVAHAEIEPHARAVLREHWTDCRLDGDVSALNGSDFAGVTLVSGGSPCQDLSIAGKRKGLEGARSGLFHQQVRIWQESGAPYCLWENVLGALSSNNGEDFGVVLSTFVGAAVPVPADGWGGAGVASGPAGVAAWRVLDCQFFGPPQRRRRVFVFCARTGGVDPSQVLLECDGLLGDTPSGGTQGQDAAADAGDGTTGTGDAIAYDDRNQAASTTTHHTLRSDGIGSRVSDAVLAKAVNISDATAKLDDTMGTLGARSGGSEVGAQTRGVVLTYDTRGNGDGQTVNTLAGDHQNRVTDYTALIVNQRGPKQIATAFNWQSGGDVRLEPSDERANTPQANQTQAVVLRNREGKLGGGKGPLVSEDKSLTLGTSNDQVAFPSVALASGEKVTATLTADYGDKMGLNDQHVYSQQGGLYPLGFGVPRRLTPKECERLMGWPDDEKVVRFTVCSDPQKSRVPAENLNHRSLLNASPAEETGRLLNVSSVAVSSRRSAAPSESAVGWRVEIDCGTRRVTIGNAKREWSWYADAADAPDWCAHLAEDAVTARKNAKWNTIVDRTAPLGEAGDQRSAMDSARHASGSLLVVESGNEITGSASGVGSGQKGERCITSEAGRSSPSLDLHLQTLCCSAARVISGFTQGQTPNTSSFDCEVVLRSGWTQYGVDEKGKRYELKDTARYKLCGNGVASPVAGFIGWMLREAIEREA